MKKRIILFIFSIVMASGLSAAVDVKFNGYYKSFFTYYRLPGAMTSVYDSFRKDMGAVSNSLKFRAVLQFSSALSLETSYKISPVLKSPPLFAQSAFSNSIPGPKYRFQDFDEILYPGSVDEKTSMGIYQNLDRLCLSIKLDFADIFIGRQPVAWGSAKFVNPTDILAPFTFNELDKEERRGTDALRIRMPIGDMGELDAGVIMNDNLRGGTNAAFLRGKVEIFDYDVSLSFIKFYKNLLVGFDISGAIGGAGVWVEGAYVFSSLFGDSDFGKELENYMRLSLGLEYSFSDKFYGFAEYHFNSIGSSSTDGYIENARRPEYSQGSVYLLGKHYLNLGVSYSVTQLISGSGMIICNLNDGSVTVAPSLDYNIAQNMYIGFGAYLSLGKGAEVLKRTPEDPDVPRPFRMRSEFGFSPSMIYTSFRVYF